MTARHSTRRAHRTPRHASPARRHLVARTIALVVVGAVAFVGTGAATAYVRLEGNIETHDITAQLGDDRPPAAIPDPKDPHENVPRNILLIGSDERSGENAELGGEVEGMRADTTILMHISADRQRVELVSVPRDSHVDIPSCELSDGRTTRAQEARFNAAFSLGGQDGSVPDAVACTIRTFETLTQVRIDGWVVVDFAGFVDMVEALDGIPMCIPHEMRSEDAGLHVQAGNQVLDGPTALAFARARKGLGLGDGSDTGRVVRQQELLAATAKTVLSKNLLTDSAGLFRFLTAATRSLTTDPATGNIRDLVALAYSLRNIPSSNIALVTVPIAPYPADPNQVVWTDDAAALWAAIAADQPALVTPAPAPADPSAGGEGSDPGTGEGTDGAEPGTGEGTDEEAAPGAGEEGVDPGTDPGTDTPEPPTPAPGVSPITPDDVNLCG